MSDLLKGVLGGGRTLLVGWIVPFALVAGLFVVLVLPSIQGVSSSKAVLDTIGSQQGLVFVAVVIGSALVLNALQTPLYRILEGYLFWPAKLVVFRTEAHRARRDRLRSDADKRTGVRRAIARERPRRYPVADTELTPTTLGNAIRRFETYAFDRFRLDSQLVWQELRALAPSQVVEAELNARSTVDFFVCLCYSLALLSLGAFGTLVGGGDEPIVLTLTVLLGIGASVLAYQGAVISTDHWASTVRALVNLGRIPLARSLGLAIPSTLEEEREMWRRVNWLVRLDFDPHLPPELNPYRASYGAAGLVEQASADTPASAPAGLPGEADRTGEHQTFGVAVP